MKQWWDKQAARIDALSLRERAFLFLSVIACCLALADVVWLSPAQLSHRQLTERFEKQNLQLQSARDELKAVAQPVDSGQGLRNELGTLRVRLDGVNQQIREALPAGATATPLAQVLVHILRRHEGLTLVRTSAVAPQAAKDTVSTGAGASASPGRSSLTRQGVELTVSGSYHELTRYVQTLEKELPYVRWGAMKMKSDKLPPELTLQLYIVGVQS